MMRNQPLVFNGELLGKVRSLLYSRAVRSCKREAHRGFTLVETLVAIALISVAIVAPMALTVQSLNGAFFARDQITASNLAQEGIEAIRSVRDHNILLTAHGTATPLFGGILLSCGNTNCTVDATQYASPPADLSPLISACSGACAPLNSNGHLYSYQSGTGWAPSNFTRTVSACYIQTDGTCSQATSQEVRLTVTVSWKSASYKTQQVQLSENLYNWVQTGSAT